MGKKGTKDWPDFLKRIDKVLPHIEAMDITCARSMYNIDHKVTPKGKKLMVELSCIRPDVEIRYTEDGTEPVASSSLYASPLTVKSTTCIKAATFMNGEKWERLCSWIYSGTRLREKRYWLRMKTICVDQWC